MFASGVGKNGNQTLGAAAIGGMLIGTLCQILVVPALFVIFQGLQEKFRPMKFEGDDENPDVATELQQYAKKTCRIPDREVRTPPRPLLKGGEASYTS